MLEVLIHTVACICPTQTWGLFAVARILVFTSGCGAAARLRWGKKRTIVPNRTNCSGGELAEGLNGVPPRNPLKGPHRLEARLGTGEQQMASLGDRDMN